MTNNRKPVDEVRLSWDAKAAFKSLNAQGKRRQASIDDERLKTTPYTPPPNVAAWLKAQADKPKGRDYDAILRAAKKAPVGYWEDAPTGIKFGGQPLPSASTKPHGKDVDTADGPWPKCINWGNGYAVYVFTGPAQHHGKFYRGDGTVDNAAGDYAGRISTSGKPMPNADAAVWLEQNGHKDVAAQLRGTPRADVATGGGREWMNRAPRHLTETCYEHWRAVLIDGIVCTRGAWNKPGVWSGEANDVPSLQELESGSYPELFGPERDAILSECRKAMGL